MKHSFVLILSFLLASFLKGQSGQIKGRITDKTDMKPLSGVSVNILGTNKGTYTNSDGLYELKGFEKDTYTIVISHLSYISINKTIIFYTDSVLIEDFAIEPNPYGFDATTVRVKKAPKPTTEKSIIKEIKENNNIVIGISGSTISKTQDRDGSEVIRRMPGVTVIENRFIMVRGLSDRYNSVFLNGVGTASSEADKKSFSFDIIPSALIDKILIYKTPSAELPGDFAGGMVKIFTKSAMPEKKLSINFALGYRAGTTFNSFSYSSGSSTDILGYDNGSRKIPIGSILQSNSQERKTAAALFKNNWIIKSRNALPDGRFNITYAKRFNLRSLKLVSLSHINYTNTNSSFIIRRKDSDPDKDLIDQQFTNLVRVGALQNFALTINKNNSIEFRNLFNQFGRSQTTIRNSALADAPERGYSMGYQSRGVLTSQLSGTHEIKPELLTYTWTAGYTISNRNEPDLKRIKYTKAPGQDDSSYSAAIPSGSASPEFGVRFYSTLKEKLYSFSHNIRIKPHMGAYELEVNLGNYLEYKDRHFDARLLGYVINPGPMAQQLRRLPVDRIFSPENISNPNGFSIDELTEPNYSYTAQNKLFAQYASVLLPYKKRIKLIVGARYENNLQSLNSFLDQDEIHPKSPTKKLLPSVNLSYELNKKNILRVAYGKTLNRPEFREWSPFKFYDFDFGTDVYGSLFKTVLPGSGNILQTATIDNFDCRYELYPSSTEVFHIGVFYKKFKNPIEQYILPSANRIFTFANAASAYSRGIEIDLRKNLDSLGRVFRNLTFVSNISIIQSEITLNYSFGQDLKRPMQGQSPYVLNAGFYYQSDSIGLQVSLLYNVIGPRIFLVGTNDYPSWGEMPKQNLDLSINKTIHKHLAFNIGIQDILNQAVLIVQDSNKNGKFERNNGDLHIMELKRGSYYTAGFRYTF